MEILEDGDHFEMIFHKDNYNWCECVEFINELKVLHDHWFENQYCYKFRIKRPSSVTIENFKHQITETQTHCTNQ